MVLFFFSLSSCAQNKVTLYSKAYKIAPKINITLSADELVVKASEEFNNNFTIVTGETLKIERSNSLNNNYSGELCDLMGHYLKFRYELLISYVIAVVIKFYNNYY